MEIRFFKSPPTLFWFKDSTSPPEWGIKLWSCFGNAVFPPKADLCFLYKNPQGGRETLPSFLLFIQFWILAVKT